jgi:hypothetical protein
VTIFGVTSTVSASGDQGSDPNHVVGIVDLLGALTLPTSESFSTLESAGYGQVLRGVSLAPTAAPVPETATWAMMLMGIGGLGALLRTQRRAGRNAVVNA